MRLCSFDKHAQNPRVRAFYAAMSGVAGEQLEKVGVDVDAKSAGASREKQRFAPPAPPPPISGPRIVELS